MGQCLFGSMGYNRIQAKDADRDEKTTIGIASLIGGGVATLTGIALLIADGSSSSARNIMPHVTPVFGLRSMGLVGTF